jgi:hypothetical protein
MAYVRVKIIEATPDAVPDLAEAVRLTVLPLAEARARESSDKLRERLVADNPGNCDSHVAYGKRLHVRELEYDDGAEFAETRRLLSLSLDFQPEDGLVLRRAAFEVMRVHEFETAMELRRRLERAAPTVKGGANSISRCEIMMRRQASSGRAVQVDGALAA